MVNAENILEVIQRYFVDTAIVVPAIIALLFLVKNAEKKYKCYAVMLGIAALLLFNDITYRIVLRLEEADTFYRFLWIIPVTILCGYLVIEIWSILIEKKQKIAYVVVLLVIVFGNYKPSMNNWLNFPENVYQIPNEQMEAAEILVANQRSWRPTFWDDGTLTDGIREYDATIMIQLETNDYMEAMIRNKVINEKGSVLREGLITKEIDSIGIKKEYLLAQKLMESAGARLMGETESSYLYRFEFREAMKRMEELKSFYNEAIIHINEEYISVAGQVESVEMLYLTDMHIDIGNQQYLNVNGITAADQFAEWMKFANDYGVDAVLLGVDMLDTYSKENILFLEKQLESLNMPYLWIDDEQNDMLDMGAFHVCASSNEGRTVKDMEQGEPVILLTNKLFDPDAKDTKLGATVTAVIGGGTHVFNKCLLQESIMQYVAEASYEGTGTLIVVQP